MTALVATATVLSSAVLGVAVPWVFMLMLAPSLESSPRARATNYRGASVSYGLGVVWLVWAGCAIVGGVVAGALSGGASVLAVLTLAGPLALVAFSLGVVDDAYGSGDARGFRGHLAAMLGGRLTTGGLKLLGIGAACLVVALVMAQVAPWGGKSLTPRTATLTLIAGAAIALTSNFVNLTDLRPGRALKVYSVLALGAIVSVVFGLSAVSPFADASPLGTGAAAAGLGLFLIGPVVAVWGPDLGERGMLGDAGANPMGAVAGMLIVAGLPSWGLVGYFVLVLALNVASERISFSRVIESNALLSRLDMLGRSHEGATHAPGEKSSHQQDTNPE